MYRNFLLGLLLAAAAPAAAQADPAERAFAMATGSMKPAQRAQFCAYVGEKAEDIAAEAPDPQLRARLAADAQGLRARAAPLAAAADARQTPEQRSAARREIEQTMGLLSYAPSNRMRAALESGAAGEDDILRLFVADVAARCQGLLDAMKVPPAPIPAGPVVVPAYRWRGKDGAGWFAGTALAPVAARICSGSAIKATDLANLPLAARGEAGLSLLDWAMACNGRAAFTALLDAGHDPDAPGIRQDPPLVRAADRRDLWFLQALLAKGARPDAQGTGKTALATSFDRRAPDGGEAFRMLRAAGASLNFPDPAFALWHDLGMTGRWDLVVANWTEFRADPVKLGRWVTVAEERAGEKPPALAEIKRRLMAEHGVCFPVLGFDGLKKDARGHYIQPDCPKPAAGPQ